MARTSIFGAKSSYQPCRQGSGQMCTESIFGMIPRKFFTASGWVLCVGLHRETDSFSHPKPFIFTEIMSPTGINRAAGLSLALLPCRQACHGKYYRILLI